MARGVALLLLVLLLAAAAATTTGAKRLSGMDKTFCLLELDGQVYCAGSNSDNRMGVSTSSETVSTPSRMLNIVNATDVCVGKSHSCVVDQGSGKCVGKNEEGSLGIGSSSSVTVLTLLPGLENLGGVSQMFCGDRNGCALLNSGGVRCWGNGEKGTLGDGSSTEKQYSPVVPTGYGSSGVMDIALGKEHACLLTTAGKIFCQGNNEYKQIGDGSTSTRRVPTAATNGAIASLSFVSVACGEEHTCAVAANDGAVYCWGRNKRGQFGSGSTSEDEQNPVKLSNWGTDNILVWAGASSTFVIRSETRTVLASGMNEQGGFGTGSSSDEVKSPVRFGGSSTSGVLEICGGKETVCALFANDVVKCAGRNEDGQFGTGSTSPSSSSTLVTRMPVASLPPSTFRPTTKRPTSPTTRAPTSKSPTVAPTRVPTAAPSSKSPTAAPTKQPTVTPTNRPTSTPTKQPTAAPTHSPTLKPTIAPSLSPSTKPTSAAPSTAPTREGDTRRPTHSPTLKPTNEPTLAPTLRPTEAPSLAPTREPTFAPTLQPTREPTLAPTLEPTTLAPTKEPTPLPSFTPSLAPTRAPTREPTEAPTHAPSLSPTLAPTKEPSLPPTHAPSLAPTRAPTHAPSLAPTLAPTKTPTDQPTTLRPSTEPSLGPTLQPTTLEPTLQPTTLRPSRVATVEPTTRSPTIFPQFSPTMDDDAYTDNDDYGVISTDSPTFEQGAAAALNGGGSSDTMVVGGVVGAIVCLLAVVGAVVFGMLRRHGAEAAAAEAAAAAAAVRGPHPTNPATVHTFRTGAFETNPTMMTTDSTTMTVVVENSPA